MRPAALVLALFAAGCAASGPSRAPTPVEAAAAEPDAAATEPDARQAPAGVERAPRGSVVLLDGRAQNLAATTRSTPTSPV